MNHLHPSNVASRRTAGLDLPGVIMFKVAACLVGAAVASVQFCLPTLAQTQAKASKPNFVVIMVDDMGYSDPGCYGGEIDTPNINRLAEEGVRFREFYNCSRCCQTRASMLTGAYPERVGMREFGRSMQSDVPTIGENLRQAGYRTAMSGKWHLTELPERPTGPRRIQWMNHELQLDRPFGDIGTYPTRRGFDDFYGIVWGVVDHFDPFSLTEGEEPVANVPDDYYASDAITDYAVKYIDGAVKDEKPFFLYVAYTAPHWPIQARPEDIAKYKGRYTKGWQALRDERFAKQQKLSLFDDDTPLGRLSGDAPDWQELSKSDQEYEAMKMAVHAAMVDGVDQGIGRIMDELNKVGADENTIVLFLSDNGASPEIPEPPGYDRHGGTRDGRPSLREAKLREGDNRTKLGTDESYTGIGQTWATAVNTPLRLWKAESYDGGCRTPMIVRWSQGLKVEKGSITDQIGHVVDIAPTLYELAGVESLAGTLRDGVSLAPVFVGDVIDSERPLFFQHGQGAGVRLGKWKASKRAGGEWELFDMAVDPGETNNLAKQHPEQLTKLVDAWNTWQSQLGESSTDLGGLNS
ncbi:arylsulfatase [Aeoliella sp. SH292]|uniref:arylsulfatase n=1 Tax=Aeoliella sp. SH292 TaxID=3454464 RepID=UPI003F95B10F